MKPRAEILVALAWGCVVAGALYPIVRAIQFVFFPDPNPALVVWSAHAGYFWRVWTVVYAGGLGTFVALAAARRDLTRTARALAPALTLAALAIAAQGAMMP